ncbi:hypothetical protein THRCLA_00020 [Thraustotheca clavata]|uniref:HTH La-type RNA-binding domain-containing protein n=1 Tax=Thraustotheca clavata TaxID=74557 RepID=A0A1W0ACQ0_9STRA|nr:hypothetical protein THRCLA_00020 [Thraustotheca clavata]
MQDGSVALVLLSVLVCCGTVVWWQTTKRRRSTPLRRKKKKKTKKRTNKPAALAKEICIAMDKDASEVDEAQEEITTMPLDASDERHQLETSHIETSLVDEENSENEQENSESEQEDEECNHNEQKMTPIEEETSPIEEEICRIDAKMTPTDQDSCRQEKNHQDADEEIVVCEEPQVDVVAPVLTTPPQQIKTIMPMLPLPSPTKKTPIDSLDYVFKESIVPSSPTSSASTVSSSSYSPRKLDSLHLSSVYTTRPASRPTVAQPKRLVRSHSTTEDGRTWRDVLGGDLAPPPQPVLAKTVSLGGASTVIHGPQVVQSIVDQIEFYFSDVNLRRDAFLRQRMDAEGYVYISVVMNFNRVRAMMNPTVSLLSLVERLDACPSLTLLCKRKQNGEIDPSFVQLGKIRPASSWQQWVPANALPTHHPFDLLLRKVKSTAPYAATSA